MDSLETTLDMAIALSEREAKNAQPGPRRQAFNGLTFRLAAARRFLMNIEAPASPDPESVEEHAP